MNRRVFLSGVVGVAVMLGGGWLAWQESARRAGSTAAPGDGPALFDLTLPDPGGRAQPLERYRGRPLVVNFWATWCAPCVKEMPDLDALHRRFPKVQFVGIGVDTAENITQFIKKVPVAYPLLVAGNDGVDIVRSLGNTSGGLPFTVVFDADGSVRRTILGQVAVDDLAATLSVYDRGI